MIGFGSTLLVFYPGIMTYDAKFVHDDIAKHTLGDWQSPAMTVLWRFVEPVAPGAAGMFLLIAASYWAAFAALALAVARRASRIAVLLPLIALTPPAFVFVGIIWRDVLFATSWLLAGALVFAAPSRARRPAQALALALCLFGLLLRPNALIAAPVLAAYVLWPAGLRMRHVAIVFVPAMLGFAALIHIIYYDVLGATRQHPLQSIMVFDLGGISHFARQNQFPTTWDTGETARLLNDCYKPTEWDIYWRLPPCDFVMHKLETQEKLFGTSAIVLAWARAIVHHPVAYLEHRGAFMWNFLTGANLTMWVADIDKPSEIVFHDRRAFMAVKSIHDLLKPTPLFRAGTWLIICLVVCAVAWPRRRQREGAFALGTCGSAAIYVLTFLFVGVASDFRYAYWAVLAALTGGAVVVSCRVEPDPGRIESRRWWPIAARGRRINPERTHSSWVASVRS